jgi:heat shock protein HtpX
LLHTYGAREVTRASHPEFYDLVAGLARQAELPMPRVYLIDSDQPNAFATGRNPENAAVAASTGLLTLLTRDEVAGVIGHELAHIRNYDTLIMTVAASIAGAVATLADIGLMFGNGARDEHGQPTGPGLIGGLLLIIFAPMAAMLVQMAISRTREYEADRIGATISGRPHALASALERIHHGVRHFVNPAAEVNPATAHLFIINPLQAGQLAEWFSTHPPTAERVRRLRLMSAGPGSAIGRLAQAIPSPITAPPRRSPL